MLTPEQQQIAEGVVPHADKLAGKLCPGDDEARSVAYLAVCETVARMPELNTASVKTYCLRRVRGAIEDYLRKEHHSRKKKKPIFISATDSISSVDEGLQWVEIDDLLSVLRPDDREIFRRKVFQNEPVESLAKWRGCSVSIIYRILARCKERLRREIDGDSCSNTSRRV